MKTHLILFCACICCVNVAFARGFHRSFQNGYPVEASHSGHGPYAGGGFSSVGVTSRVRSEEPRVYTNRRYVVRARQQDARTNVVAAVKALQPTAETLTLLGAISAPVEVGVQPRDAVRDLCRTADGEIRHYGRRTINGQVRRVYIASRDEGLSWQLHLAEDGDVGAMVKSPFSGDWLYFTGMKPVTLVRSKKGPGDTNPTTKPMPWRSLELRQLIALKSRRRWVAAFSDVELRRQNCYATTVAYSDDDGRNWTRVDLPPVPDVERQPEGDQRPRWFNNGCEPSIIELKDGTIRLAARTSGPNVAFCQSADGGATWGAWQVDRAFWHSNTMPLFHRLADGRLLFVWNNTAPFPTRPVEETPELDNDGRKGVWESVFTNRDALHAAISDDDGKTWKGFREIALNDARNASDFRELGNTPDDSHDKSVHQTQALNLAGGKVLLAYGQNAASRRLVIFDPNWLLQTRCEDDFRNGLGNVSHHLYVKAPVGGFAGWGGHCAMNRVPGVVLMRDDLAKNIRYREIVRLCRIRDQRLVSDRQGIVWNFPAARQGQVTVECRLEGEGYRLSLCDHWLNPSDEYGPAHSPFSIALGEKELKRDVWQKVVVEWNLDSKRATLFIDEKKAGDYPIAENNARFGLSYLHLQTLAEDNDPKGVAFRKFTKE